MKDLINAIGEKCPNCDDEGYYAAGFISNPEQVQCEFCYTVKNSIFNINTHMAGNGIIPLDPRDYLNGVAKITNQMKAHCIGEISFTTEEPCSKCALHLDDHYDDVECECGGSEEMMHEVERVVPWTTCKDIYQLMAKVAMLSTITGEES